MEKIKKLKILFVPTWYPSKFSKIAGVFVKEHAKSLNNEVNLAVFHICGRPTLKKLYEFEIITEDDILTYRIYYRSFNKKLLKPLSLLLFYVVGLIGYKKVIKLFGKPNLNHIHVLTRTGVLALVWKLVYKTPFVITEHWSRYLPERNSYKGCFRKWLTKLVVNNSEGVSAVTKGLRQAMQGHSLVHKNFKVIANVVNTAAYKEANFDKNNLTTFKFLHVSGLNDGPKNISGMLRAIALLKETQGVTIQLEIVGDDVEERPILEKYAASLGLSNHVFFVGKKYGQDLINAYQRADAFLMFSNFENQPCVILEAMSCGLPIVSTAVGGIAEVVNNDIGLLVTARDEQALADAIAKMAKRELIFDSKEIRKIAVERYSYNAISSAFLSFYETALTQKKG